MKKTVFIILLFSLFRLSANGQLNVTSALENPEITMGDHVNYYITYRTSSQVDLIPVDLGATFSSIIPQIEVLETGTPSMVQGETGILRQTLKLTSFDTGNHVIPEIPIAYLINGDTFVTQTNKTYLSVYPIQITEEDMSLKFKDILHEETRLWDWLPKVLIPLGILLAIGLIVFIIMRRKKAETALPPPPPPKKPAHEIALKQLNQLRKNEFWQNGKTKRYYSELSRITREYLENRFNINALESVTDEILPELKHPEIPSGDRGNIKEMLQTADLVKFAKVKPDPFTHGRLFDNIESFVKATKKRIEPQTPQNKTEK